MGKGAAGAGQVKVSSKAESGKLAASIKHLTNNGISQFE
jgi:hypothetical protein